MSGSLTGLEMCELKLTLSALEREREEELKRRVTAQMHRVEAGEITSHRLMQVIDAELEIIYRNRAEAARREIDWRKSLARPAPTDGKD